MKILTYTTLYPNAVQPHHGIFVEQRLLQMRRRGDMEIRVVAPVPWFPWRHRRFGRYAAYASIPRHEERSGITVMHPRYVLPPKIGMHVAPFLMAAGTMGMIQQMARHFELLDAHYFYPDGVAAAWIARRLKKPLVITARGTDVNLIPAHVLPRRMIQWAARQATAIVTVCQALKDALVELGVDEQKIYALRNGVDLSRFAPVNRESERARLGLTRTTLLSVGLLIERKGHYLVIEALRDLPDVDLLIVGQGEDEECLRQLACKYGVAERVRFVGAVPQAELKRYYGAADILVLASSREGWANVLLESMACGTPVVATRVWGTPEVVTAAEAGILVKERTAGAIAGAVRALRTNYPDRASVRRYAERFGWEEVADAQRALYQQACTSVKMT